MGSRASGPVTIRSLARGALAASSFAACARLGTYAGWSGYAEGRSRLVLGIALACVIGALLARVWSRLLATPLPSLGASLIGFAGLAFLLRKPGFLHPTANAWLDAILLGLLPAVPLAAHLHRRWTSPGLAALGAATSTVLDGVLLEPRLGLGLTLAIWCIAWAVAERRTWGADEEGRPSGFAPALGLLVASAALGAAIAISRPFLVQHLPAERAGRVLLLASALGLGAFGWLLAGVLARTLGARWTSAIGGLAFLAGSAAAWFGLSVVSWGRGPGWLEPLHQSSSSPARTALAIWIVVALPAAACGLLAKGLWTRGAWALAASALGIAAGTVLAERLALPAFDAGGTLEASAQSRVRIPPLREPSGYALNAEGARVRYPLNSSGEMIQMSAWQGIPRGRERTWSRLETCEILEPRSAEAPAAGGVELLCIGSVQPSHEQALAAAGQASVLFLDPLPSFEQRAERGGNPCAFTTWDELPAPAVVLLSEPVLTRAGSLLGARTSLLELAARTKPSTALWIWCDPRALRPDGLRSTLATWRSAFPGARVHVLLDGYAGPLVGLQVGQNADQKPGGSEALALLELVSAPVADLRTSDADVATLDRLLLESRAESGPPPFDHPGADTIRALADALGLPVRHPAPGVLEALARHAAAQEFRRGLTSDEDRVRVVQEELDALRETLRSEPPFAPAIRHCEAVAAVLYRKREYDVLLGWMRELSAALPEVGAFHRYLGLALLELLDKAGALAELELAVSLAPESAEARAELSKLYSDAGRHPEALRLLESVWQDSPSVEIAKGLGLSYLAVEDFAHARQYLEYARARAPLDGDVAHALERLEAGGH